MMIVTFTHSVALSGVINIIIIISIPSLLPNYFAAVMNGGKFSALAFQTVKNRYIYKTVYVILGLYA